MIFSGIWPGNNSEISLSLDLPLCVDQQEPGNLISMEKRLAVLCTDDEFTPEIHFLDDLALFQEEVANNAWDTWQAFALRLRAEELAQRPGGKEGSGPTG